MDISIDVFILTDIVAKYALVQLKNVDSKVFINVYMSFLSTLMYTLKN